MIAESVAPATRWAFAFLRGLVSRGVRDVVISPGSRSQALALVAAEFADRRLLAVHVVIDERVGAYLALGLAVESQRPVAIVVTSGTAVANLHPGVLEAHHAGIPLIVVTADRPEALRSTGANQTTTHIGAFGVAARKTIDSAPPGSDAEVAGDASAADAVVAALTESGPIHVNAQFAEPLSSTLDAQAFDSVEQGELPESATAIDSVEVAVAAGRIVVAGYGAGPRAEQWARELGAPLIAEIASGAHFGPHLVTDYRHLMSVPEFADAVSSVIVVGRPTLSREIDALCARKGVDVTVVRGPEAQPYRPHDRAHLVDGITVTGDGEDLAQSWALPWARRSRITIDERFAEPAANVEGSLAEKHAERADFARQEMLIQRQPVTPEMLVRAVWDVTWPHDRLVFGASRLIRVADSILPGKPLRVHANRGLSGIDGTIATAQGIAAAAMSDPEATHVGVTRVVLGDLAAQHDIGALANLKGSIQVIVGNDGGGRIFDDLPVATTANPSHFDRVMRTPQSIEFESAARTFGLDFHRAQTRGELTAALSEFARPTLIEVVLPRD
jgi:2-succinyl-5-enolpyruvyl-6-hydroxy-3-cyclohexene-1-carboxylate synthase